MKMSAKKESIPSAKIVLLGESATGAKTSLVLRFVKDTFDKRGTATIGSSLLQKVVEVDGFQVKLEIWGLCSNTRIKEFTSRLQ